MISLAGWQQPPLSLPLTLPYTLLASCSSSPFLTHTHLPHKAVSPQYMHSYTTHTYHTCTFNSAGFAKTLLPYQFLLLPAGLPNTSFHLLLTPVIQCNHYSASLACGVKPLCLSLIPKLTSLTPYASSALLNHHPLILFHCLVLSRSTVQQGLHYITN